MRSSVRSIRRGCSANSRAEDDGIDLAHELGEVRAPGNYAAHAYAGAGRLRTISAGGDLVKSRHRLASVPRN